MRTFAATSLLARLSCSSPLSSPLFGLLRSAGYCSPSLRRFDPGVHLRYSDLTLDPERGVGSLRITASKTDPFRGGGGGGGVRAPLPHRLRSVPSPRYTSSLAHTPPSPARVRIPGRVILDPGPLGAHPPRGIPFLLRPEHPLLPHRGRVRCGCHGLLLGHDPGPRAVAERLLQALRTAPLQMCSRPSSACRSFRSNAGALGAPTLSQAPAGREAGQWRPAVGTSCRLSVISDLGSSSNFSPRPPPPPPPPGPLLRPWRSIAYRGPPRNGNYQNAPFTQDPDCCALFRPPLHWPGLVPVEFPRCSAHQK